MEHTLPAKAHLDGRALVMLMTAGIRHVFQRRSHINEINVFPVPDADTGTNLSFTFKTIQDALSGDEPGTLHEVVERIAEAALDGARGNSGAIMAQFFQGCRESLGPTVQLSAVGLANVCKKGAEQAWTAMSEPVAGTLPTVLEDFAEGLKAAADEGLTDICEMFQRGLEAARVSLANTPNQLPVLKRAGVVDAGGQGFVDLLDGMHAFVAEGVLDPLDENWATVSDDAAAGFPDAGRAAIGEQQFCTECVIEGGELDRSGIMERLQQLDHESLVVAGSTDRVRVHIHVNQPGEVFLACEEFGELTQQKADDMRRQHSLLNQPGTVAVVTDSGADLPASEAERLGIHVVPVRLSFGDREYLDGVSLTAEEFYRKLEETATLPTTSQPPARDFRRVFELLVSHGYDVLHVGLSTVLSGTTQAARTAAGRMEAGRVRVIDTRNASCGQGLLAMVAAEAAAGGKGLDEIGQLLARLVPITRTLAIPNELTSAVRGGRVPAWLGTLARGLRVTPIMQARAGRMALAGARFGRGASPRSLARRVLARMKREETYWILVSHAANPDGARQVRQLILGGHSRVHSCHVAEAGPALGAHLGKGGLIVGFLPDPYAIGDHGD